MAFNEIDKDGNNSLDDDEFSSVMKEVAREFKVTAPTDADITYCFQ